MKSIHTLYIIHLIILLFCSCKKDKGQYVYDSIPEQINDGFETAHLSSVGIDENLIAKMFTNIKDDVYKNIHSV